MTLDLEKEYDRIDAEVDVDSTPAQTWIIKVTHNGEQVLKTKRTTDADGEIEVMEQVANKKGTDKFVATATGPDSRTCTIKLSI